MVCEPLLKDVKIITHDLVAIELKQTKVDFDQLFVSGWSCLEVSKIVLAKYIYRLKDMFKNPGEECNLLLTGKN